MRDFGAIFGPEGPFGATVSLNDVEPYAYVAGNPLNATDPSGKCLGWLWGASDCVLDPVAGAKSVALASLEVVSTANYGAYYAAYRTDSTLQQWGVDNPAVHGWLMQSQVQNLATDIGIDQAEQWVGGKRPLNDEGIVDHVLPLSMGPKIYLPGWHQANSSQIDLSSNSSYPWGAGFGPPSSGTASLGRGGAC